MPNPRHFATKETHRYQVHAAQTHERHLRSQSREHAHAVPKNVATMTNSIQNNFYAALFCLGASKGL